MDGPSQNARIVVPTAADPTHRQAAIPCEKPIPVAPTVDPAPMLAASIVEKIRPGPRLRPATKKSDALRTRRPIQRPSAISATEYEPRMTMWRVTMGLRLSAGGLAIRNQELRNFS